jgi:hypothetical protein
MIRILLIISVGANIFLLNRQSKSAESQFVEIKFSETVHLDEDEKMVALVDSCRTRIVDDYGYVLSQYFVDEDHYYLKFSNVNELRTFSYKGITTDYMGIYRWFVFDKTGSFVGESGYPDLEGVQGDFEKRKSSRDSK